MTKLRIISGKFGSRLIDSTEDKITHPMGDRVRSALFAKLFSRIGTLENLRILDAFAGTGAIGLEALSRGAEHATFVDRDRKAKEILEKNVKNLDVSTDSEIIFSDVKQWISRILPLEDVDKFDIIFCDAPYDKPQWNIIPEIIKTLRKNGLMIISYRTGETLPDPKGVVVVDKSSYGEASLVFYRKIDD